MSIVSDLNANFVAADVCTCTSLRCTKVSANTLNLVNPLSFTGEGVRIGMNAGAVNQGANAIAIGDYAAPLNQPAQSIVINATGAPLNAGASNSLYIAPIREANGSNVLFYNVATKEVTQATGGVTQTVSIVDNLAVTHNLTFVAGVLVAYTTTP